MSSIPHKPVYPTQLNPPLLFFPNNNNKNNNQVMPPSSSSITTSKPKRKPPASNPLAIRSILSHIDSHLNSLPILPPILTKPQALAHLAHLAATEKFPRTGGGRNKAAEAGRGGRGTGGEEKFHTAKTLWDAMGYVVRSYKREEFRDLKGREATLRVFGVGRRMLEGEYLGRIGFEVGGGGEEEEEGKGRGEGEGDRDQGEERGDDADEWLVVQNGGEFQGEKKRWGSELEEREMGSKKRRLLRQDGRIVPPLGLGEMGRMRLQSSSCLLPSCGDSTTLEQQEQQQHCIDEQVGKSRESSRKMVVYEPVVNDPLNKKNKNKKKILPPPSPSHIDSKLQHHLHLLRATISDFSTFFIQTTPPTKSSAGQHLLLHLTDQQPLPLANQDFSSNLKTLYRKIFQDNNGFWRDAFEDFVGVKKKKEEEEEMNKEKRKKNQGKKRQEITPSTIIQAMIWTFLEMEVFGGCVLPLSAPAPPRRRLFSLSETEKMANHHHQTRGFDASTPFVEKLWRILMEHFTFFSSPSSSSFPSTTILRPTPPQQLQTIHTQALLLQAEMSKKAPSTMMISSEKSSSSSSSSSSYYRFFKHSRGSIAYCRRFLPADDGHHHHHHHLDKNKNKKNNDPSEEEEERGIEKVAFTIAPGIERVSSSSSSSSSSSLSGEKTTVVIEPAVIALLGRSGDG